MRMDFGFAMEISLLVLLAATVFLAFRLTLSLRNFKESRFEMEGLINRLTSNIGAAEKAMAGMQNAARKAGAELDEVISDAKKLADELKIMNKAGDGLADRLEKLADKNRALVDQIENAGGLGSMPIQYNREIPKSIQPNFKDDDQFGFDIQDRDYDDDFDNSALEAELEAGAEAHGGFQSQAERELFEALQTSKTRQRGRA